MTKCDALTGVAEEQQCVDVVRKQYGQMEQGTRVRYLPGESMAVLEQEAS